MFDPVEFLDMAEELIEDRGEARARTSVGRAYYASFLCARGTAGLTGLKTPDVHRKVVRFLYAREPLAANLLHLLRRQRNHSDYDLQLAIGSSEAKESIKISKRIINSLKGIEVG